MSFFVCVSLLALQQEVRAAEEIQISGTVVEILSGDRFVLFHPDHGKLTVSLQGVAAPLLATSHCPAQPWAEQAKRYLQQTISNQQVLAICNKKLDLTGAANCRVLRNQLDVNRSILEKGYAWFDRRTSRDLMWQQMELEAKNNKIGLWSDRLLITAPWRYQEDCAHKR